MARTSGPAGTRGSCQSAGASEGELVSTTLTGELGVIKESTEGPLKDKVGTDLKPVSGEVVAEFACAGMPVQVDGSVIGEVKINHEASAAPVVFVAHNGVQSPTRFEGGETDVLSTKLGETGSFERSGLSLTLEQTSEEAVEINSVA